jgi:hypothetical protein
MVVHMRWLLVVALTLVGTAACSYVFELPATSISPTEADASDDASEDAPVADAPPTIPFCASQTAPFLYCNDFDSEPTPDLATIGTVQTTGGQLLLSNAVAFSPPRSLLASVRSANATASVTHALGANPDGVTLSFRLLVSAWDTTAARLSAIVLADGTAQCSVRLEGTATTWTVTQVCEASGAETARVTTETTSPIVRGQWQRFALAVAFAPTSTVTLDMDGVRTSVPGVAPLQRAPTSVALGATLVPDGGVTIFQDDVLVTSP